MLSLAHRVHRRRLSAIASLTRLGSLSIFAFSALVMRRIGIMIERSISVGCMPLVPMRAVTLGAHKELDLSCALTLDVGNGCALPVVTRVHDPAQLVERFLV